MVTLEVVLLVVAVTLIIVAGVQRGKLYQTIQLRVTDTISVHSISQEILHRLHIKWVF